MIKAKLSFIEVLIGIAIMAIILAMCYDFYADAYAVKIEIRKDQWDCTNDHDVTNMVLVGKLMVPMTNTECVNYTRKEY